MKKLIVIAVALCSFVTFAASEYMVYDFALVAKTTRAKGVKDTSCGNEYVWRDSASLRIRGIIAGCGCNSILANGSCDNALVLLWNENTKTQITNFTFNTWIIQRIGKSGEKVEHIAKIKCDDFEVMLGGLGSYLRNHMFVTGHFGGFALAPYLVTLGSCNACMSTPDSLQQSIALAPCEDGACTESTTSENTPFFGTYSLRYNTSKSARTTAYGISSSTLGTPVYVDINKGLIE